MTLRPRLNNMIQLLSPVIVVLNNCLCSNHLPVSLDHEYSQELNSMFIKMIASMIQK